jgi:superfamily II DNA or RNA helicase
MTYKPRGWQIETVAKFRTTKEKHFLLDATPGGGKTMLAGFIAIELLTRKQVDFALVIVPNTTIKGDEDAGFLGDWNKIGIQITRVLKDGQDLPREYRGAVITYQQLPNMLGTIGTWVRNGVRIFAVFDEIHHASEDNNWGEATEELGRLAVRVLGMTGTCFRGDERRISFVKYDAQNKAIADDRYPYRRAVSDHVCRPVGFITDDSMTQFMLDNETHQVRVSEADKPDDLRGATSTVFRTDHEFLPRVIAKADDALEQYRSWDRDAGGLIICRSGKDDSDNRHLHHVADLVSKTLGEEPEVISYDDKDANAKIARFRKSNQRWICAVRKISEGVDIKRLRVLVMATRPTTELLFRQQVGRVVRVDDEKRPGDATVFIAKFPQLVDWAAVIAEEAAAGLKDPKKNGVGGGEKEARQFMSFAASHEAGGAVSDYGDEFTADEVNAAERLRGDDPQLADISITALAHLQRKLGVIPEPMVAPELPLQIQKQRVRGDLVKKQRRLAIQRNPQSPDYKRVWKEIGATFGVFNIDDLLNHHSIEVMRQVDAWLLATIARESSREK